MEVHMMHPDPAASRWKTVLSTFLGVIFPHPSFTPPTPFPRLQAFATFFANASKVRKATADKPVRPPALSTAFTPKANS
jgi:hypothetical protein